MVNQAIDHANIFLKQQTVGKMSDHKSFAEKLLNLIGTISSWLKINKMGAGWFAIRIPWYAFFVKRNIFGGVPSGLESVYKL